jgi:hypothetical protein
LTTGEKIGRCPFTGLEQGCTYRAVLKAPIGTQEMTINVERLTDCEDLLIRCIDTGTFVHMALTDAQGGTFVDSEAGMEAMDVGRRVFDVIAGKRYFRVWMSETLKALDQVARERARGTQQGRLTTASMGDPGLEPGTSSLSVVLRLPRSTALDRFRA